MAKSDIDFNKVLGTLFSANKIKVKRTSSVLSTGSSIFYDNLVAEEVKEKVRQKKLSKKEKRILNHKKEEEEKKEPDHFISIIKKEKVRFLWSEAQPVISSGILDKITTYERTIQEAKFEIITTEITYLNSINELITNFMENNVLPTLCTTTQWQNLFGNIIVVKAASELLLNDLVQHWHEDLMMTNIYTVLRQHAISILRVYKEYCRKQPQTQIILTQLNENQQWKKTLIQIETENMPNNSFQSYLSLPMQRVTRLPLLLEAVLSKLQEGTNEFTACKLAISALKKLAKDCNEAVGQEKVSVLHIIHKGFKSRGNAVPRARPASWSSTSSWNV